MITLEALTPGLRLRGLLPQQVVTLFIQVTLAGDSAELFYQRDDGTPGTALLFRADEAALELAQPGPYWDLTASCEDLRLAAEAYRINLAHLFDPRLAVHTSLIEPLPHQITAVYGEMLPRQPLRFLLADDPGAGKTIVGGLLLKELIIRGDVQRCLICAPGSLTEQWQAEMWSKFQLHFAILSRERIDASRSGNPFLDDDLLIIRLDQVARSDELQALLKQSDWDLIICDEAHKMSASYFGDELKDTKRFRLGKELGRIARHFLLMTATPHNGKEEDFQLFLSLLDADRFEGRYRPDVTEVDASDLMRRMVKEKLLKFDGRPLFPERQAHTLDYELAPPEWTLYEAVTDYVRQEFNRADQIANDGRKRGTIGFALTVLQRRLASSPEAIYQSLHRRRLRLEERLAEARRDQQAAARLAHGDLAVGPDLSEDDWDELSAFPDDDFTALEIEVADSATAARTIAELAVEIATLRRLEQQAATLRRGEHDRKWAELADLMQDPIMITPQGSRRKLVIFTEHRDTLDYLHHKLATLLGSPDPIVAIHGAVRRTDRLTIQERFRNEAGVTILLATDAAGEGINLQRAHLMVNYDLPWNPNRLEQRFGRIHRIGQTEVCHLWNLVAGKTREGHVYQRLLGKLKIEKAALHGQVFDVLGDLFRDQPLRALLVEAIRYGDRPEVRARLDAAVDNATDQERVRDLLEQHSLAQQVMDTSAIERVRVEMERAAARRLQPFYIKAFFSAAFALVGGSLYEREPGRYQINHVPASIRDHAHTLGGRRPLMRSYERVCFEKHLIDQPGKPTADFICPGHLLLDVLIDLVRGRYGAVLKAGAVYIDPTDPGQTPRALFFLEHSVRDAASDRHGQHRVISREVRFVEYTPDPAGGAGQITRAGDAPYLDYRAPTAAEALLLQPRLDLTQPGAAATAQVKHYAIAQLAPQHLAGARPP
ncbi:MAG: helicase-related protein [Caldilineaceae bacterium]